MLFAETDMHGSSSSENNKYNMLKLSIIIPVYNVEPYIANCLDSCLQQDIPIEEYEIIVVNDGSPDNSVGIVGNYMQRSPIIRLVNRDNGGLSAARNTGLKEAKGEYVWFIDSDDWIEPNVLKGLTERAYRDKLDVLCFNLQLAFADGHIENFYISSEENGRVFNGCDFIYKVGMPPAAWAALYRRDFLEKNALCFYDGILHEDQEFTPRSYCLAERIAFVDQVVYNYNQREGGIMKSKQSERKCKDLLTVADSLYAFIQRQRNKLHKEAYWTLMNHVSFAFSQSLANYRKGYFNLSEYKQKPYYPLCINPLLSNKNKWKYRLINLSLSLYLKLYRLK